MDDKATLTLKLNPDDLLITLNQKLAECSNAVFFGMNAIELTKELPETIRINEDSVFTHKPIGKYSFENSKTNFHNWIIKKGFEDLIIALTELLISFSFVIDLNEKIKVNPKLNLDKFRKLIFEPNDKNSKKDFPQLLKKVSNSLKSPLRFSEEVKTINRVRRCFVHRNGIVKPLDFNTESQDRIQLNWWFYEFNLLEKDEKKPLERFAIINSETKLQTDEILKTKVFKENERIKISFQEFNELCIFCQMFGYDLLEKFKLN